MMTASLMHTARWGVLWPSSVFPSVRCRQDAKEWVVRADSGSVLNFFFHEGRHVSHYFTKIHEKERSPIYLLTYLNSLLL